MFLSDQGHYVRFLDALFSKIVLSQNETKCTALRNQVQDFTRESHTPVHRISLRNKGIPLHIFSPAEGNGTLCVTVVLSTVISNA